LLLRESDACAGPVEPEIEALQVGERGAHPRLRGLRAIEQQEPVACED
jgi:hypothetical protein